MHRSPQFPSLRATPQGNSSQSTEKTRLEGQKAYKPVRGFVANTGTVYQMHCAELLLNFEISLKTTRSCRAILLLAQHPLPIDIFIQYKH